MPLAAGPPLSELSSCAWAGKPPARPNGYLNCEPGLSLTKMAELAGQLRYVVLRHTGYGQAHFDLMIEPSAGAAKLLTWRVPQWPLEDGAVIAPLGEHRRDYLEYEGPVSGGRGVVKRAAGGTCEVQRLEDGSVRVRFDRDLGEWQLESRASKVS